MRKLPAIIYLLAIGAMSLACRSSQPKYPILVNMDTPGTAEASSATGEHFGITAKGTLDIKSTLPTNADPLNYEIFVFVHPIAADGWWRQSPATVRRDWEAQAYLGGTGQYSAKNGERFEIIAVVARAGQLADGKYGSLQDVLRQQGVIRISEIQTVIARR